MPNTPVTKRAIDGFFSCSGKLFHVFSQSQVSDIVDSVYSEPDSESEGRKASIGSLMAVAAVGSQYANTAIDNKVQETFYTFAKYHLDAVITQRPLDAIKVCTLLCMYNVFGKATVSLAYADAGLGICDRYGLHCPQRQLDGIPDSTWLSATLGYKPSNYKVIQQISPSQLQIDDSSNVSEVVQTEMTKIALLKAKILHMHLAFQYLAPEPLDSMIKDLQDWYLKLPPQMQLQSLSERDMPLEAKRSIYHVHLLYLGANMLLFRRIVAENVQIRRQDINISPLWHPSSDLLSKQGPNALLAATSSAKIVKLLLDENSIFQRCWLIIFQSYTSCVIIMHAILTKLVSSSVPSSYEDNMKNASLCLEALAYCGAADPVARRFHEKAQAVYNSDVDMRDAGVEDRNGNLGVLPTSCRLSIKELSFDLLVMLCRPFGDPSYRESTKESLAATHRSDPSRCEHPVLVERLEWDFEDSVPFQWNPEMLGFGNAESGTSGEGSAQNTQPGNRFLDSRHPSGWT
ncbi:hypothetical protein F4803DRAFT_562707 [Xylaria telfairii]|nr:hypothetical protein F4803DRAFT_562707 [Xylaria telfairii]